ncbi:MAG: hypothetical protein ACLQRH_15130 [Acidimicrobiales bacterium]
MAEKHEHIHVRVTFPISKKGPFEHEYPADTTVGVVLAAAMEYFEVQDDSQFTYVLTFDGLEQADTVTIGSLAGQHDRVHFTLVKKITQG